MELRLRDLEIECVLGDLPAERAAPRTVCADLTLELSGDAGTDDDLGSTVDYAAVCALVRSRLAAAECRLLERAARIAAEACLEFLGVLSAVAEVSKRGSIPGLGSASAVYRAVRARPAAPGKA